MRRALASLLLNNGGVEILRQQLLAHHLVGFADPSTNQRPIMVVAKIEQFMQVNRLMRTVKVSATNMDNPR